MLTWQLSICRKDLKTQNKYKNNYKKECPVIRRKGQELSNINICQDN